MSLHKERINTLKEKKAQKSSGFIQSHINRYEFAANQIKDKIVLDIACGDGYGAFMLSKVARQVYAVDLSEEAIKRASSLYENKNLSFIQASGLKLPFADSSVDVVVSFETIEHMSESDGRKFLLEIKRVLKDGGRLILSTPEKDAVSLGGLPVNPFHLHEYSTNELAESLGKIFKVQKIYYQDPTSKHVIKLVATFAQFDPTKLVHLTWRVLRKKIKYTGQICDAESTKVPWVILVDALS